MSTLTEEEKAKGDGNKLKKQEPLVGQFHVILEKWMCSPLGSYKWYSSGAGVWATAVLCYVVCAAGSQPCLESPVVPSDLQCN